MAFRIGDRVFVHADGSAKMTPEEGRSAGQPFTVRAAKSIKCEFNGKAVVMRGNRIEPVAIELAEAEPSFAIGLDVMQVSVDLAEHVGDGYARTRYGIVVVYTRPQLAPVSFLIEGGIVEKGFGLDSESGGGPKDEISGKCRTIRLKYKGKIYDPFALPGGSLEV